MYLSDSKQNEDTQDYMIIITGRSLVLFFDYYNGNERK